MAPGPDFANRDPLSPQFWDERFERDFTPWERGWGVDGVAAVCGCIPTAYGVSAGLWLRA